MVLNSGFITISSGLPQFPGSGLWSTCEQGTASTRRVLTSGPPAAPPCSDLMSITRALLGTARGGVQGARELCQSPVLCWLGYSGRASVSML